MSDLDRTFERPDRRVVVTALGITQILAWGSTLYLLGVLGHPIALDTGWSYEADHKRRLGGTFDGEYHLAADRACNWH